MPGVDYYAKQSIQSENKYHKKIIIDPISVFKMGTYEISFNLIANSTLNQG